MFTTNNTQQNVLLDTLSQAPRERLAPDLKYVTSIAPHPAAGDADGPADSLRTAFSGRTVLLVENNPRNLEMARHGLNAVGLAVDQVTNAKAAVEKVAARTYDIVLMDVNMPIMDGLEATREIRNIPGREGVPILAMTAHEFVASMQACLEAGMNEFMGTPVEPEALYKNLLEWLHASAANILKVAGSSRV